MKKSNPGSVKYGTDKTVIFLKDGTKIRILNFAMLKKEGKDIPKNALSVSRGTDFGNPFHIGYQGSRRVVIRKFKRYARRRLKREPEWLEPLRGKDLVCFCSPRHCHAEIIVQELYGIDMGW